MTSTVYSNDIKYAPAAIPVTATDPAAIAAGATNHYPPLQQKRKENITIVVAVVLINATPGHIINMSASAASCMPRCI